MVEQFRQPKRFLELARRARAAGKFIVLLHPGRSKAAQRIGGHAYRRARRRLRSDAHARDPCRRDPRREHGRAGGRFADPGALPRIAATGGPAIFTESGAFKALALDLCEQVGLRLPALSSAAERALREALPAFIPPSNPLDLTAQGLVDPGLYRRTLPQF